VRAFCENFRCVVGAASAALLILMPVGRCDRCFGQEADAAIKAPVASGDNSDDGPPLLRTYMGRTIAPFMDASGAEWLTRKERDQEEQPTKLMAALPLESGNTVCDFGCGNGFYTLLLAKRVGPTGKVYAVDIQKEMLDKLAERMDQRSIDNVIPVLATDTDPKLPAGAIDLLIMVDVYHELSHPAEALSAAHASLKPRGRLVLVEFREEDASVPIKPLHKMSQAQVLREISANRFKLVGQFDGLPWQHVMMFARDDSALEAQALKPWKAPVEIPSERAEPAIKADSAF
jgi:ubiquinone/menaquinone biosynthesis C-methylase UbiE